MSAPTRCNPSPTEQTKPASAQTSWHSCKLSECALMTMGQSPSGETYNSTGTGAPLINGPAEFGEHHPTAIQWTTSPTRVCKPNDILFCVRGNTTGRINIADCEYCIGRGVASMRGISGRLDTSFLRYVLIFKNREIYNIAKAGGSTFPNIGQSQLSDLSISVPEALDEQEAVSHTLQTVENANESRKRELALERERKAALMEHLFRHGTRCEATKQTEIGEIPESWNLTSLGELCKDGLGTIQTGPFGSQLHASDYIKEGIPVVNPTHLGFNCIETSRVPKIGKKLADSLSKHYLLTGDILISRRGDFSRYAYVGADEAGWLCGTGCMLIRLTNPAIDNYFLALSMSLGSTQDYLKQAAVGSIMPNINTAILSQMPVLVPAMEEQCRIAAALRASEMKIRALEAELPFAEELFDALLAELMSGHLSIGPILARQEAQ